MHIGHTIRAIRLKLNIPQKKLALDCKISKTSLSLIENGVKKPSQKTINTICTVIGIPEVLLHILAIQEEDVSVCRRHAYRLIHPSIVHLTLQSITSAYKTKSAVASLPSEDNLLP